MTDPHRLEVPPFAGNVSFNAQHSPAGAFMSFTCGNFGTRGGFGLQIGQPGDQDLYIGVKAGDRSADAPLKVLPFYQGAAGRDPSGDEAARYDIEQAAGPAEQNVKANVIPYAGNGIRRHYGWATDTWVTDDFRFTIYTPFDRIPEPNTDAAGVAEAVWPGVLADLTVDNTDGSGVRTAFFALKFGTPGMRLIGDHAFGHRRSVAVSGEIVDANGTVVGEPFLFCRWAPDTGLADPRPHHLGTVPGLGMEVPSGQTLTLRLTLAAHLDGVVTTGIEGKYLYTRYYAGVEDVAARRPGDIVERSRTLDAELLASGLSPERQFLIAHATRSYYGSTQLLDVGGAPYWLVNEGEYVMMHTLDLAVDHVFWELRQNPWVVRNTLENYLHRYSFVDDVKTPDGRTKPGGLSFAHDMGVHGHFSPRATSSYELAELVGCFSHMTAEQLCNWTLLASCYVAKTGDSAWAATHAHTLAACVESFANRSGEGGYVAFDSARCGGGSEITTYDSLDHSLAQTRNNVYMAVKCWASLIGLETVLKRVDTAAANFAANAASSQAKRIEADLATRPGGDGVLPAVFEADNPGYASRILPAAEGLIYPWYWRQCGVETEATELHVLLKRHTEALLNDPERRNHFSDGGLRLSSTSGNSWMSKIAIFQTVAERVFGLPADAKADTAHVAWQTTGESSYWACSDQMLAGVAKGSKYYPRIVTTCLWMTAPHQA